MQNQLIQSQRLSAMGELISGIEHEINNALTGLIGHADLALYQVADERLRRKLEIILQEGQRAVGIVRNLRTFAQKGQIEKQPVSLNQVVQSVLSVKEIQLKLNNIKVITGLASELPETMADFGQLQQLLLNLIINAEEAILRADGKGTIHIKTEIVCQDKLPSEGQPILRFSVTDDGAGVPEDIKGQIFEPFFTIKDEAAGVGQGLSICFGIVNAHRGRIYLDSEMGKGSTFFVELPVVDAETADIPGV